MAWRPSGAKPFPEPMVTTCHLEHGVQSCQFFFEIRTFSLKKLRLKLSSAFWRQKVVGLDELTHRGRHLF